jgi:hypothetical protein
MYNNVDAIMTAGISIPNEKLGAIETEIFISAISASKANYTEWRRDNLYEGMSVEEIANSAAERFPQKSIGVKSEE